MKTKIRKKADGYLTDIEDYIDSVYDSDDIWQELEESGDSFDNQAQIKKILMKIAMYYTVSNEKVFAYARKYMKKIYSMTYDDYEDEDIPDKDVDEDKDSAWNYKIMFAYFLVLLKLELPPDELVYRLKEYVEKRIKASLIRNIRTWMTWTENKSLLENYMNMEEHVIKIWYTVGDDRVRESHQDLEGEERELDEPFSNGLMYPGDPSGPASEIMNCRCSLGYRTCH